MTFKITKCFLESVLLIAMIVVVKILDGGDDEADENGNKSSLGLTFSPEERFALSIEP